MKRTTGFTVLLLSLIQIAQLGWGEDLPPIGQKPPLIIPEAGPQWQKPNPLKQDVNGDGRVDVFDLVLVGGNFGKQAGGNEPLVGDVNGDGVVNEVDLNDVGKHFGEYSQEVTINGKIFEIVFSSDKSSLSVKDEKNHISTLAVRMDPEGSFYAVVQQNNMNIGFVGITFQNQTLILGATQQDIGDLFRFIVSTKLTLDFFMEAIGDKNPIRALSLAVKLDETLSGNSYENPFKDWMFEQLEKNLSFIRDVRTFEDFFNQGVELLNDARFVGIHENIKQLLSASLTIAASEIQINNVEDYYTWYLSHRSELETFQLQGIPEITEAIITQQINKIQRDWLTSGHSGDWHIGERRLIALMDNFRDHKKSIGKVLGLDPTRQAILEEYDILVLDHTGHFSQSQVEGIYKVLQVLPKHLLRVRIVSAQSAEKYPGIKQGQHLYESQSIYLNEATEGTMVDTFHLDGFYNHPVDFFTSTFVHELFQVLSCLG